MLLVIDLVDISPRISCWFYSYIFMTAYNFLDSIVMSDSGLRIKKVHITHLKRIYQRIHAYNPDNTTQLILVQWSHTIHRQAYLTIIYIM